MDSKIITPEFYNQVVASGSELNSLYGLPKAQKQSWPVRPILNAKYTDTAKLSKLLMPIPFHLEVNKYTVLSSEFLTHALQCTLFYLYIWHYLALH